MNPIVIAVLVLLVLIAGYFVWRSRRGSCTSGADCTPPDTCQNGKCAPPPTPEVYLYDVGRYGLNLAAAQQAAAALGATVASSAQVAAAQAAGAEWCWAGWDAVTAGGNQAVYPMQSLMPQCGSGPGVQVFSASPAATDAFGVNLYGPKPSQGEYPVCGSGSTACVLPFSSTNWSQYAP